MIKKVVFAGGGSGGHLTPSFAVAEEFLASVIPGSDPESILMKNQKRGLPSAVDSWIPDQVRDDKGGLEIREVLFIASKNGLDEKMVIEAGFPFRSISTGKLRRYFSWENFLDFFRFLKGIGESIFVLRKFKADLVFSKGGFVALPVALAAFILGIPVVAHESDTVQGLANKIIAKFAKVVCVAFPFTSVIPAQARISMGAAVCSPERFWERSLNEAEQNPPKSPLSGGLKSKEILTGTPIRSQILQADVNKGQSFLGFKNKAPIVLFMGASQGAQQINEIAEKYLHSSSVSPVSSVIHAQAGIPSSSVIPSSTGSRIKSGMTGAVNVVLMAGRGKLLNIKKDNFKEFEYLGEEFADVVAAADIVISRAGANSMFELAALGKASIFIPLDSAAGDHQRTNAALFEEKNAAVVFDPLDKNLEGKVIQKISQLLKNTEEKEVLEKNIKQQFVADSAKKIVKIITRKI